MPKKQSATFEEQYAELDAAVQKLELGELTLEESIALYERGMALAVQLEKQLAQAELRVQKLQPDALDATDDAPDSEDEDA